MKHVLTFKDHNGKITKRIVDFQDRFHEKNYLAKIPDVDRFGRKLIGVRAYMEEDAEKVFIRKVKVERIIQFSIKANDEAEAEAHFKSLLNRDNIFPFSETISQTITILENE